MSTVFSLIIPHISSMGSGHSKFTGRVIGPRDVFSNTTLTFPSLPGCVVITLPNFHTKGVVGSVTMTS